MILYENLSIHATASSPTWGVCLLSYTPFDKWRNIVNSCLPWQQTKPSPHFKDKLKILLNNTKLVIALKLESTGLPSVNETKLCLCCQLCFFFPFFFFLRLNDNFLLKINSVFSFKEEQSLKHCFYFSILLVWMLPWGCRKHQQKQWGLWLISTTRARLRSAVLWERWVELTLKLKQSMLTFAMLSCSVGKKLWGSEVR